MCQFDGWLKIGFPGTPYQESTAVASGMRKHTRFTTRSTRVSWHRTTVASLVGPVTARYNDSSARRPVAVIALYFALTFAAGHLNQEVRDYDGDLLNGIRTNAVRFGKTRAFWAGFAGFTAAYAWLGLLALRGLVPPVLGALLLLYPLHLGWTVATVRAGLGFDAVSRFQARYRILYGIIGLVMLAALFLQWIG